VPSLTPLSEKYPQGGGIAHVGNHWSDYEYISYLKNNFLKLADFGNLR